MKSVLLICSVSPEIGMGHLSRLLSLANTLKKDKKIKTEFLIFGDLVKTNELSQFTVYNFSLNENLFEKIKTTSDLNNFDLLVFDLRHELKNINYAILFAYLKERKIFLISIDSLIEYSHILDLIWMPSICFNLSNNSYNKNKFRLGWDTLLIDKRRQHKIWSKGFKILILTGGSDYANLGSTLPAELDKTFDKNFELHWVKGPFSQEPDISKKSKLNWTIHRSPQYLDDLITQSNYVITVFGISFFEALQYGIPTVVFSPNNKDEDSLKVLSNENVAIVADNTKNAVRRLFDLVNNDEVAKKYATNALKKMSNNGTMKLANEIYSLLGNN